MTDKAIKTHYLDASAILKLFIKEDGSEKLEEYFSRHSVFFTTSLCFAEALSVLKRKKNKEKILNQETYLAAAEDLCISAFGCTIEIDDISIAQPNAFRETERMAKKYNYLTIEAEMYFCLSIL